MFRRSPARSDVARARLQALAPGWIPTQALIDDELSGAHNPASSRASNSASNGSADGSAPGLAEPCEPDMEPRWQLEQSGARGLLLLIGAALLGAAVVVVIGWPRGEAAPLQVSPITGPSPSATDDSPSPDAQSSTSQQVVVDVAGLVKRPGIVELPVGSRVIDALESAGGALRRGDTSALNLAQLLTDGQQVVVADARGPSPLSPVTPSAQPPNGALVSVNSATLEQLETLPGIGPVLAQAIIDWRSENGGFTAIEQLQEVSGIGEATYAELQGLVSL